MIPRANVTAWRKHVPWTDDAMVEQDLVLCRALVEMFSSAVLSEQVALRGGTALNKLFFESACRFSEDIDLVQNNAGPIGLVMNTIRERLDGWLGSPTTKQGHGRVTLNYRFLSEFEPAGRRRLKIEINTREHFSVLGLARKQFDVSNPWFEGTAPITAYQLEELLGTKLRALFQRKKGRDLFDLSLALSRPGSGRLELSTVFFATWNTARLLSAALSSKRTSRPRCRTAHSSKISNLFSLPVSLGTSTPQFKPCPRNSWLDCPEIPGKVFEANPSEDYRNPSRTNQRESVMQIKMIEITFRLRVTASVCRNLGKIY